MNKRSVRLPACPPPTHPSLKNAPCNVHTWLTAFPVVFSSLELSICPRSQRAQVTSHVWMSLSFSPICLPVLGLEACSPPPHTHCAERLLSPSLHSGPWPGLTFNVRFALCSVGSHLYNMLRCRGCRVDFCEQLFCVFFFEGYKTP